MSELAMPLVATVVPIAVSVIRALIAKLPKWSLPVLAGALGPAAVFRQPDDPARAALRHGGPCAPDRGARHRVCRSQLRAGGQALGHLPGRHRCMGCLLGVLRPGLRGLGSRRDLRRGGIRDHRDRGGAASWRPRWARNGRTVLQRGGAAVSYTAARSRATPLRANIPLSRTRPTS